MLRPIILAFAWSYASVACAPVLHAQLSTIIQRAPGNRDSAAIKAAFAKADTGRMTPADRNPSAYKTAGQCLQAVNRLEHMRWRTELLDTLERLTPGDTMTTAARQIGRSCMASMTPKNVTPPHLDDLRQLALQVGDTAMVRAVIDRQLSLAPDAWTRGKILNDALDDFFNARPRQERLIEEYFKRFDTASMDGKVATVQAYSQMKSVAWACYDLEAVMRFSLAREKLLETIPREVRYANYLPIGQPFLDSIEIVQYKRVPDLPAVATRLTNLGTMEMPPDWKALTMASTKMITSIVGKPFRPLSGIAWFPDSVTTQSLLGKVTLVISLRSQMAAGLLAHDLARYRRFYEQYKDRGFQVVLIDNTGGGRFASRPLEPQEEAKVIGWFFREFLKLPFSVVVQKLAYHRIADGRRVNDVSTFQSQYADVAMNVSGFLVGRDGNVLRVNPEGLPDAGLDAWIRMGLEDNRK